MTGPTGRSQLAEVLVDVLGIPATDARRIVRAIIRAFLDSFCPVPDGLDTQKQWQREIHEDLSHLSRAKLLLEQDRLELRLKIDQTPDPWLPERLARVREAIRHAG
jgi:hypothetical protein